MRQILRLSLFWLFIGSFSAGRLALAVPTLYPDFYNKSIRNNTTSNYMADTEDARRFYVLPPNSSLAQVRGLHTVTANVGFCSEIAKIQKYNSDTLDLLNAMKVKDKVTRAQLDDLGAKLVKARADLMQADSVQPAEFARRKALVELLQRQLNELNENWRQAQNDLKDLYVDFNRMFDAHARREGGRVSISYNSRWNENVEQLKRDNPFYNFEKVQTKNAAIRASAYSRNNLVLDGSILAFDVGGVSANGILNFESYPESFSGNAVLNLLAVCPILHPEWFDPKITSKLEDMAYGLTVSFEYPSAMKYEFTVHYNMYKMFESIKSQGQSGGFFSRHSWSDSQEQEFFKDSFRIDWKIQDDRRLLGEEQKLAISSDIRRQMLTRLAGHLVMNDPAAKGALTLDHSPTGALVLSDSLNKFCPLNLYCKGASLVLNVLQSIFGSTSARQSIRQITDVNMEEHYSSEQVVLQPMLTTYR